MGWSGPVYVTGEENQKVATEVGPLLLEKGVNGERHTHTPLQKKKKYILDFDLRYPHRKKRNRQDKVSVVVVVALVLEEEAVVLLMEEILHQLSLVAYPIIYRFLYISGGWFPY